MEHVIKSVIIDIDLLFDIQSLVFSITKDYLLAKFNFLLRENFFALNEDNYIDKEILVLIKDAQLGGHKKMIHRTVSATVNEMLTTHKFTTTGFSMDQKTKDHLMNIMNLFIEYRNTIKPKLPSVQFLLHLKELGIKIRVLNCSYKPSLSLELIENFIQALDWEKNDLNLYTIEEFHQFVKEYPELQICKSTLLLTNKTRVVEGFTPYFNENCNNLFNIRNKKIKTRPASNAYTSLKDIPLSNFGILVDLSWKGIPEITWEKGNHFVDISSVHPNFQINSWSRYYLLPNPLFLKGKVIGGFGRGSTLLRMPTANMELNEIQQAELAKTIPGIFFGHASLSNPNNVQFKEFVDLGKEYRAFVSIGFNPHFSNKKKTIEAYLGHSFECGFYGAMLELTLLGCIRVEAKFESLEDLCSAMELDILIANKALQKLEDLSDTLEF